jgi:cytochrome oxidase Cu insertion factor (SCO1/SenC/PrrC family)
MRVAALLALVLAVAGCGGESETTAPATTQTTAATATQGPPSEATTPVEGTTLDGEPISLADFRGKPVFVNVWSSW